MNKKIKHFYVEYNEDGIISYDSFGVPVKNGYTFLQFPTLNVLRKFLEDHEFSGGNLVAQRCMRADVVRNLGQNFEVVCNVCIKSDAWGTVDPGDIDDAQIFSNRFDLEKYEER